MPTINALKRTPDHAYDKIYLGRRERSGRGRCQRHDKRRLHERTAGIRKPRQHPYFWYNQLPPLRRPRLDTATDECRGHDYGYRSLHAWGNVITRTGTTGVSLLWIGEFGYYRDAETGFVHCRMRTYAPTTSRWTAADPVIFVEGFGLYAYA